MRPGVPCHRYTPPEPANSTLNLAGENGFTLHA